jgi:hypothetical protein
VIKIIDLYSGNPRDFDEALNGNFSGVIFKGGQGDWLDVPKIQPDWWNIAGDKGLLRGWYWVCDSRYHSSKHIETINRWRDDWKIDPNAELGFWSDVEYPYISMTTEEYWKTPYAGHKNVVDFHYLLEVNGINAGLYSGDVYNEIMKGASSADHDYLAKFRMWPANYPYIYIHGISKPRMFGHWKTWTLWQYHGNPDYNDFNGTDEEFYALFGGAYIPPVEPPQGGDMYKITTQGTVNIRETGGAVLGKDIGNFVVGQTGFGSEIQGSPTGAFYSLKVTSGADIVGWVYARFGGGDTYATIVEVDDPPPPTGTLPIIHLKAEGYPDQTWTPL